jgi:hypothetical protein
MGRVIAQNRLPPVAEPDLQLDRKSYYLSPSRLVPMPFLRALTERTHPLRHATHNFAIAQFRRETEFSARILPGSDSLVPPLGLRRGGDALSGLGFHAATHSQGAALGFRMAAPSGRGTCLPPRDVYDVREGMFDPRRGEAFPIVLALALGAVHNHCNSHRRSTTPGNASPFFTAPRSIRQHHVQRVTPQGRGISYHIRPPRSRPSSHACATVAPLDGRCNGESQSPQSRPDPDPPQAVWINPPKPLPRDNGEKTDLVGSPPRHDLDPGAAMGTPKHSVSAASITLSPLRALH